jgi:hypothetical protein
MRASIEFVVGHGLSFGSSWPSVLSERLARARSIKAAEAKVIEHDRAA